MMELNHTEQMALFEGLMDAEYCALKLSLSISFLR